MKVTAIGTPTRRDYETFISFPTQKKTYETYRFQLFIHDLARFGPRWRTLELGLQVQVQHER